MKFCLSVLLAGVAAAAISIGAAAQVPAAGTGPGKGPSPYPMDCTKAKDKAHCESLNKDIETCRDKTGDDWRDCMHRPAPTTKFTPPKARDCTKAQNKERCEAHNQALAACADKTTRAEHRKCMAQPTPAPTSNTN